MSDEPVPGWTFLTNHARCSSASPATPASACATSATGWGSPSARRTASSGSSPTPATSRGERNGRRNQYAVNPDVPLHDPMARERSVGELVEVLTRGQPPG